MGGERYDLPEDDGFPEDYDQLDFSKANAGDFRSKVTAYSAQPQFPSAPLYSIGEEVFLQVPGQTQPAGPYKVVAFLEGRRYKIARADNGQEHHEAVAENRLLVRS